MKRIDKYKRQLDAAARQERESALALAYQELMNQLITYRDKQELTEHYDGLRQQQARLVCQ